jgi:hypothetical protein
MRRTICFKGVVGGAAIRGGHSGPRKLDYLPRNSGWMCGYQPPAVPCATGTFNRIALASADNVETKEHTILDNASFRGTHTQPITLRSTRVDNART